MRALSVIGCQSLYHFISASGTAIVFFKDNQQNYYYVMTTIIYFYL